MEKRKSFTNICGSHLNSYIRVASNVAIFYGKKTYRHNSKDVFPVSSFGVQLKILGGNSWFDRGAL